MQSTAEKRHLSLVVSGAVTVEVPVPSPSSQASSTIVIEIGREGALQKLEINVRKEDVLQALHGLVMAHMRALDLLTH